MATTRAQLPFQPMANTIVGPFSFSLPPKSPILAEYLDKHSGIRHFRRTSRLNAHRFAIISLQSLTTTNIPYRQLFQAALTTFGTLSLQFQQVIIDQLHSTPLVKTDCSYSILQPPFLKVNHALKWKQIGDTGHASIPDSFYLNAVDTSSRVKDRKGYQVLKPLNATIGPHKEMIQDLKTAGIIAESPLQTFTMNLSLRPKPNSSKSLLINDCRSLISNTFYAPRHFKLPNLSCLFHMRTKSNMFFTKLDLSNAYHSVHLPDFLQSMFRFAATELDDMNQLKTTVYVWKRLPFGWDRSPKVFQEYMTTIIAELQDHQILVLSYLDDILLVGPCKDRLENATESMARLLQDEGFIISPHPKSVFKAVTSLVWLGKLLVSSNCGISIGVPDAVLALLASLIIVARAKKGPARMIATICGIVAWANSHSRLAFPFMGNAQAIALRNRRHLKDSAFVHLIQALHATALAVKNSPIKWGVDLPLQQLSAPLLSFPHPRQDLSPQHAFVWCDAAIATKMFGIVLSFEDMSLPVLAASFDLPAQVTTQQTAELYAVKAGLIKASVMFSSFALITDSESALLSINKMSGKLKHSFRRKLLRQITSRLMCLDDPAIPMGHVAGILHPADFYSRTDIQSCGSWNLAFPFTVCMVQDALPLVSWAPKLSF